MFHIHEYDRISYSQMTALRFSLQNNVSEEISVLIIFFLQWLFQELNWYWNLSFARLQKHIYNYPAVIANKIIVIDIFVFLWFSFTLRKLNCSPDCICTQSDHFISVLIYILKYTNLMGDLFTFTMTLFLCFSVEELISRVILFLM